METRGHSGKKKREENQLSQETIYTRYQSSIGKRGSDRRELPTDRRKHWPYAGTGKVPRIHEGHDRQEHKPWEKIWALRGGHEPMRRCSMPLLL